MEQDTIKPVTSSSQWLLSQFSATSIKVIIAVITAFILGVGMTLALTKNLTQQTKPLEKVALPTSITTSTPTYYFPSSPTPTNTTILPSICPPGQVKVCEGGQCQCDKGFSFNQRAQCASSSDCPAGAPCQNGYCIGVDYTQNQSQNSTCPSGTVRVCQAGECECQKSTNTTSSECPQVIQEPCTSSKLPSGCGYSAMPIPAGCQNGCPIICQ